MKWLKFASRFPKWVIAGGILVVGFGVFFCWWQFRQPTGTGAVAQAQPSRVLKPFSPDKVILCGNTLVSTDTGEIVAQEWLEGFGNRVPHILKVMTDDQLLLVLGNNNVVFPFDFDGVAKAPLSADGKLIGAAAFADGEHETIFVRDGNLWRGKVDWKNSAVESSRPITSTGYFRPEVFRNPWFWQGDSLWLVNLGQLVRVNLSDGSVAPDQFNMGHVLKGVSPERSAVLMPVGMKELGVVDLASGESTTLTTGQRVNKVLWLTDSKAVILVGQKQLGLYDHALKKFSGIFESTDSIREIGEPSPDGQRFLMATGRGVGFFDLAKNQFMPFPTLMNQAEWISPDTLLLSSDAIDSNERGVWIRKINGECKRLTNNPIDAGDSPLSPEGYFISGGNLWTSDDNGKQLTQGARLIPAIKRLR